MFFAPNCLVAMLLGVVYENVTFKSYTVPDDPAGQPVSENFLVSPGASGDGTVVVTWHVEIFKAVKLIVPEASTFWSITSPV